MGNKHSGVKEKVVAERDLKLNEDMEKVQKALQEIKLSNDDMQEIGAMTVTEVVQKLNDRTLTSKTLVVALSTRAGTVGLNLGLITETNFFWALDRAELCDQKRRESGKKNWTFEDGEYSEEKFLPPMYGIPISVKDVYDMKGFKTTVGCFSKTNIQQEDSGLIVCLKNAGMIPFVRSTCCQIGMTFETMSNLWGRAKNPWNQERAVGGSSGGEGGLVSGRCSIIGLGSDIGGSIRIPSEFCGVFGLKPGSRRISPSYHSKLSVDFASFAKNIPLCLGPLTHHTEDLALFLKTAT